MLSDEAMELSGKIDHMYRQNPPRDISIVAEMVDAILPSWTRIEDGLPDEGERILVSFSNDPAGLVSMNAPKLVDGDGILWFRRAKIHIWMYVSDLLPPTKET